MVSEKDKELSALQAEGSFAWHQMEKKYKKQAAEAAEKLKETVHEFQSAAQEKDDEIGRLRAEVASGKENMSILQNELEQMRSLVKSKDNEAGQLETSQKSKKDPSETNRKSKVEGPAVRKKSRTSQVTPVGREVKTTRKCISSLKETQSQSGNSSRKHNTEGRGQSETTQNHKRGSYTLSHVSIPF
jgi:chromosome segregation ATPase